MPKPSPLFFLVRQVTLIFLLGWHVHIFAQNQPKSFASNLSEPTVFPVPDIETFRIEEGTNHLVWLGTNQGIYCFDGTFFRKIPHSKNGEFSSVDAGQINELFIDREKEQLWVATQAGASMLDLKTETYTDFVFYENVNPGTTDGECTAIFQDRQSVVWFGVEGLGLVSYDTTLHYFSNYIENPGDFSTIYQISQDVTSDSILWLAGGPTGLTRFNSTTGVYTFPDRETPEGTSLSLILTSLLPMKDKIFLGNTWRNSCTIYDIAEGRFRDLKLKNPKLSGVDLKLGSFQPRSPNTIWGFTDDGMVVIDTENDSLMDFSPYRFPAASEFRNQCVRPNHLWVGSIEGLLFYDFSRYSVENHRFEQDERERPGMLTSVLEKEPGRLLVAFLFSDFIYDYDRASRTFSTIRRHKKSYRAPAKLLRLYDGRLLAAGAGGVYELRDDQLVDLGWLKEVIDIKKEQIGIPIQDKNGSIWLNSRFAGFYKIDPKTGQYRNCLAGKTAWATPLYFMDSRENFWLSGSGFSVYNPHTDSLIHFPFRPGERLTAYRPRTYEEDDQGNIWLTDLRVGGLMMVDPRHLENGIIKRFDADNNSQSNLMWSLKKDHRGRIWSATPEGLQVFDPKTETFQLFGEAAGFQLRYDKVPLLSNLFPSYLTMLSTGEMLVSYKDGFAIFHPDSLAENRELPQPYLVDVKVNEHNLLSGISFGASLPMRLRHRQDVFEFEFSSIAYSEPKKIRYRYRLQGFDENWAETGRRFLRYTHLPPGKYTFQLLALNSDGLHAEQPLEWHFRILPPWWATWWAYLAYLMAAAAAAYAFYFYKKRQWQMKAQLEMEHREAQRLKELDSVKTKLYTNITHEFRTPLTVILGMVKQVKAYPREWYSEGLQMIERNGRNLLHLVNQMLDLSKLEAGAMPVHLVQGDVIAFLKYVLESFHSLAKEKNIDLEFHSDRDELVMDYDPEKLREIISNLVSNAIKFTPEGGEVELRFTICDLRLPASGAAIVNRQSSIVIRDTGTGIPPEQLPYIFDRFYQADDEATRHAEGTGIGLALTKELVKLLGGEISVKSEVGKGTVFEVRLPARHSPLTPPLPPKGEPHLPHPAENFDKITSELPGMGSPFRGSGGIAGEGNSHRAHHLLIVEDNPDVVRYLQSILSKNYRLDVAANGRKGIEKALKTVPDIIISDVMMPEVDGFELCATLKKDERTSHIPIILLTAKADATSRIEGLECGADAYLAKPFDKEELLVRLRKMVELRKRLQERYRNASALPAAPETKEQQIEDAFMKKVRDILDAHIGDENFGIPDLCKALGMSRAQLYRKLHALTDQPIGHYLRSLRLHKAKDLLVTTKLLVSEIAYEVGFRDPSYFTRAFTEEFGENPSEVRK